MSKMENTTVVDSTSGLIQVTGKLVIKNLVGVMAGYKQGKFIESEKFMLGDNPLTICVYPNGNAEESSKGHVAVFVTNRGDADISVKFQILTDVRPCLSDTYTPIRPNFGRGNVSVLHQNEGGIGKSIPDAREISRDPRDFPRAKPEGNLEGRGKSRGRRGWISQYLPRFGGTRTFSSSSILSLWMDQEIHAYRTMNIDSVDDDERMHHEQKGGRLTIYKPGNISQFTIQDEMSKASH